MIVDSIKEEKFHLEHTKMIKIISVLLFCLT